MSSGDFFAGDEIGPWSEVKLDIVKNYAKAYSTIMTAKKREERFRHFYVDAFAGAGIHLSRTSGEFVAGSPLNALWVTPPFDEYHFIDLDRRKVEQLQERAAENPHVRIYEGDCNEILLNEIFPRVRWEDYQRGLCLLDPYRLDLDWAVIQCAGQSQAIDMFLNFPIMHMQRTVLRHDQTAASPSEIERMNRFWGDESWRKAAYRQSNQLSLLGEEVIEKTAAHAVVEAFRTRLKQVAGFQQVPKPIPMRNSKGNIIYYLIFASQKVVAQDIVEAIYRKYRDFRPG